MFLVLGPRTTEVGDGVRGTCKKRGLIEVVPLKEKTLRIKRGYKMDKGKKIHVSAENKE